MATPVSPTFMFLKGGLGNQLFQIAAAHAHAKRNGYDLQLAGVPSGQRQITYWHSWLWKFIRGISPPVFGQLYAETSTRYEPIPSEARTIRGLFQSGKHFADCADEIREKFDLDDETKAAIAIKWGNLLTKAPTMALVHVRCLDGLTLEYYERAVAELRKRAPGVELAVITNDMETCRKQSWLEGATYIEEYDESVALYLMSKFRHYVMSNTALMWWAVWLGTPAEVVITPDPWAMGLMVEAEYEDVYEPGWVRLPLF
jgi:hypothetical protein